MSERPSGLARNPTAPPIMANGHFASIGDNNDVTSYEHGVQVIDGDKEFKYEPSRLLPTSLPLFYVSQTLTAMRLKERHQSLTAFL